MNETIKIKIQTYDDMWYTFDVTDDIDEAQRLLDELLDMMENKDGFLKVDNENVILDKANIKTATISIK